MNRLPLSLHLMIFLFFWACQNTETPLLSDGGANDSAIEDVPHANDHGSPEANNNDGTPLTSKGLRIFFSSGYETITLGTFKTDGTGYQAQPEFLAQMTNSILEFLGANAPLDLGRPDIGFEMPDGTVLLPGGGARVGVTDSKKQNLLYLIKPDGTVSVLGKDYSFFMSPTPIQATSDGKTIIKSKQVSTGINQFSMHPMLIHTDFSAWPNTNSHEFDLAPANWGETAVARDESFLITKNSLYMVKDEKLFTKPSTLWSAPVDGSGKAAPIALPLINGQPPSFIQPYYLISSRDLSTMAFQAGFDKSHLDIFILKEGANTPVVISNLQKEFETYHFALSTQGTYVAFASRATQARGNFWIGKTDGSGLIEISAAANFKDTINAYRYYYWVDDNRLLFWAGHFDNIAQTYAGDLYLYDVSQGALRNMTQTNTASTEPWDIGELEFVDWWISPNGQFLYIATHASILGIHLSDLKLADMMPGLDYSSNPIRKFHWGAPSAWNYHILPAAPKNAAVPVYNLYLFDQNKGDPATLKQLTYHQSSKKFRLTISRCPKMVCLFRM